MNKLILHIAYPFLPLFALAQQNLVFNGDFEQYSACPTDGSTPFQNPKEIEKCIGWKTPTYGTSDYFNTCATGTNVDVPINALGEQIPFNGNGYLGGIFASYSGGGGDDGYTGMLWWEYIQGQFSQPLEAGKIYKFSIEVTLAESSDLMINEFGVYFSDSPISSLNSAPLTVNPQIVFYEPSYFNNTTDWIHLETYYIANGTEKFITIGNFRDDLTTDTLGKIPTYPLAVEKATYFYIDNVVLTDTGDEIQTPNVFTPNNDGVNDIWQPYFWDSDLNKEVYVLNRWGNIVYQGSLGGFSWDGKDLQGNLASEGVYFYRVSDTNISGFIQLVH